MSSQRRAHVALYGAIAMQRGWCSRCSGNALVIDGNLACCDSPFEETPAVIKRMTLADGARRQPTASQKRAILAEQRDRCLYCERAFGTWAFRGGRSVRLRVHWDHMIPFVYSASCSDNEFCAACHICNGIKAARMYQTLDEARTHLALERDRKGWT